MCAYTGVPILDTEGENYNNCNLEREKIHSLMMVVEVVVVVVEVVVEVAVVVVVVEVGLGVRGSLRRWGKK